MPAGFAGGFAADGTFRGAVRIDFSLGAAIGTRRGRRFGAVVPAVVGIGLLTFGRAVAEIFFTAIRCINGSIFVAVIGISHLAFGRTVGVIGLAAVTSFRNGSTVATVIRISFFAFGRTIAKILLTAIRCANGSAGITGIDTSLADVGRIGED